ncbi:MAG TPA: carboxypeptidase-like regulatory domain-containing protein, partial [Dyadobacter sp.]|nr:carboxypeptidase-like regulatory domain-containing protein [Dyadobacter sp.]
MRVSLILSLAVLATSQLLNASTLNGQSLETAEVAITLKNGTLVDVFHHIEQQTLFRFMYRKQDVKHINELELKGGKITVEKLLIQLLTPNRLTYKQVDKRILISTMKEASQTGSSDKQPQDADVPVKGRVTEEKGGALPGVSILVKGGQRGTVTDVNGDYSLDVSESERASGTLTLIFSFVGYVPQEVIVGNKTSVDVVLLPDTKALEELVVVGYGTQKKTSVTAAISSMTGSEVASTPITNLSNGLGGRMSGVIFRQGSGEPGRDASSIYIRGIATTGNSQPLLVVDNIPRAFQDLDPNSVESITVLKDAAAVAPYGVAGANGVILVTTKKGKAGAPTLTYNGYMGFQNPTVLTKYPNSFEYASLLNAASKNE